MLTIYIQNDATGSDDSANYDFSVLVNGREIDSGRITGHRRDEDWHALLNRLLYQNWKVRLDRDEGQERRDVRYF